MRSKIVYEMSKYLLLLLSLTDTLFAESQIERIMDQELDGFYDRDVRVV